MKPKFILRGSDFFTIENKHLLLHFSTKSSLTTNTSETEHNVPVENPSASKLPWEIIHAASGEKVRLFFKICDL